MGTTFSSVRSKLSVTIEGVTLTTRTPNGTRTLSGVRWMMRSPSLVPARSIWADSSRGTRPWMMPGAARSRTSTWSTGSFVISRSFGTFWNSTATESPRSDVFSAAIRNHSSTERTRLTTLSARLSRSQRMAVRRPSLVARRQRAGHRGRLLLDVPHLERFEERLLQRAPVELAADLAARDERDRARLLRHHDRDRVGVLGDADGRTVTAAEGTAELGVDGQGKEARGGRDPVALDHDRAVVERGARVEDADQEVVGEQGVEGDSGLDVAAQAHLALDHHDRPRVLRGERGRGEHDLVDHLLLALGREGEGERRLAEVGEHLPDLGLEH